ncbi:MAG: organomercurial lyase [Longimicrobiales bacterium]
MSTAGDVSRRGGRNEADVDRQVRFQIYRDFAAGAERPSAEGVASTVGLPLTVVESSLERLAAAHVIVLAPGTRNIWMAHPFSAVPTAYPVNTAERTYWANCAWDALGIPALLGVDAETRTQCADCGDSLTLRVEAGRVQLQAAVVHFVVPPSRFWENVGFT